jgi:hypothetical protein
MPVAHTGDAEGPTICRERYFDQRRRGRSSRPRGLFDLLGQGEFEAVPERSPAVRELKHLEDTLLKNSPNLGGEIHHGIPKLLRFYFYRKNSSRPLSRVVLSVLTILGYSLIALPATDLFGRVIQAIMKTPSILAFW